MDKNLCIALFGSITNWRDSPIEIFKKLGINYYNPKKNNWNTSYKDEEERHLCNDKIATFAILKETFSMQSLNELLIKLTLFSLDKGTSYLIVYMDYELQQELENTKLRDDSMNNRYYRLTSLYNNYAPYLVNNPFERDTSLLAKLQIRKKLQEAKTKCMHLEKFQIKNLYIVNSLDELVDVSIKLYAYELYKSNYTEYMRLKDYINTLPSTYAPPTLAQNYRKINRNPCGNEIPSDIHLRFDSLGKAHYLDDAAPFDVGMIKLLNLAINVAKKIEKKRYLLERK